MAAESAGNTIREALEPFAKALEEASIGTPDTVSLWFHPSAMGLTVGDLRRARAAYDAIGSGVKALEWERWPRDPNETVTQGSTGLTFRLRAEHAFGVVFILEKNSEFFFQKGSFGRGEGVYLNLDEAKAAAQADFERRVLSCLSTHTAAGAEPVEPRRMAEGCCSAISPCGHQQRDPYSICDVCTRAAGAGPVGEVVAWAVYRDGARIAVRLTREDAWAFACPNGDWDVRPLYARPVEEPGEVKRLTRKCEDWRRAFVAVCRGAERVREERETAEAALAESVQNAQGLASDLAGTQAVLSEARERLEKMLRPLREDLANACSSETIVRRYHVQCVDAALAAITGDAQEAGR